VRVRMTLRAGAVLPVKLLSPTQSAAHTDAVIGLKSTSVAPGNRYRSCDRSKASPVARCTQVFAFKRSQNETIETRQS